MALGAEGVLQDWSGRFIDPSVSQTQPALPELAVRSHQDSRRLIKVICVHGEEHGLPNIDMTDRMRKNVISYYSVTFLALKRILCIPRSKQCDSVERELDLKLANLGLSLLCCSPAV